MSAIHRKTSRIPVEAGSVLERINEVMDKAHIASYRELSSAIGVTRPAVSFWFNGHTVPSLKNLSRISEVFDVDLNWLMSGEGKPPVPSMAKLEQENRELKKLNAALMAYIKSGA